jgi:recombinational DNA repair ATPase RecF
MRLQHVHISDYKNLKDFTLSFDNDSFLDVFVGKNGTRKSNLFEALIGIFRHLNEFDSGSAETKPARTTRRRSTIWSATRTSARSSISSSRRRNPILRSPSWWTCKTGLAGVASD